MTRLFPLAWTLVAVALAAHQVHLWRGGLQLETNLLAMLPVAERDAVAEQALDELADSASRSVVVLLGAPTQAEALAAADAFLAALPQGRLAPVALPELEPLALAPFREALLTPAQVERLSAQPKDALVKHAQALLYQPVGQRLGEFRDDPLQLFPEWLRARAQGTRTRPVGRHLVAEAEGKHFAVLRLELRGAAFALDGNPVIANHLETARAALGPSVELIAAGVPLFAEAAAVRASTEVSTVGFGSLLAILVVMVVAFRSPRPLLLVVLSVGAGVVAGLSATALVFGKVHLMTLVFGAGLVGVAEDYGIHYFAYRQAHPGRSPRALLAELRPGLLLAMITSVAGYAMLALAPLPGLRQMALFSAVGLAAAWCTVAAWYPWLDRGEVPRTRFAAAWSGTRARWPHLVGAPGNAVLGALVAVALVGLWRLEPKDDLRALQASPPALLDAQRRVASVVGLPSPAQFYVVRGEGQGEVLAREEALTARLDELVSRGALHGYQALSSWVPSPARQLEHRRVFEATRAAVLEGLADELEDATPPPPSARVLTVEAFLATPMGAPLAPLWRRSATVVLLDSPSREALDALGALSALPGVRFVDRTATLSTLLGRWRVGMTQLLLAGYLVTFLVLFWRFRARALRGVVPTALASALALATASFLGEPLTLFHVLGLWILLGMGIDYAIFLLEHPSTEAGEAWLAVGLGAVSTFLSFGLLATSTTPAIHAFGLTLGVGIAVVWALSPMVVDGQPVETHEREG